MIKQWNSKVKSGDEVIVLGDFCFGNGEAANNILSRLRGKKYLIVGNHDRFLKDKEFEPERFKWIEYYKELNDNNRKVILSHYPIFCYNGQYRKDESDNPKTYMLYGHVHNTFDEYLVNDFRHMWQCIEYLQIRFLLLKGCQSSFVRGRISLSLPRIFLHQHTLSSTMIGSLRR